MHRLEQESPFYLCQEAYLDTSKRPGPVPATMIILRQELFSVGQQLGCDGKVWDLPRPREDKDTNAVRPIRLIVRLDS